MNKLSRLSHQIRNWKAFAVKTTECSAQLKDPTSLQGSKRPRVDVNDKHRVNEAVPLQLAESWSCSRKIADTKKPKKLTYKDICTVFIL